MAVDFSLMIEDNTLQQYLVDKTTGGPLAGGIVTFYVDNPRNPLTLKHIYQQTGTPGAYTYSLLPNPLTLSSVGTPMDGTGADVKIFYYLYDENATIPTTAPQSYYVTVVSAGSIPQFTRENFPFLPSASGGGSGVTNVQNIIVNNEFWRNAGRSSDGLVTIKPLSTNNPVNPGTSLSVTTIAPSQHDGFSMPDILLVKNQTDGTDSLSFVKFSGIELTDDITPEYYINYTCTVAGTATVKYIQIPLSFHLQTLLDEPNNVVTIQGKGTGTITLSVLPYAGTGAVTVTPVAVFPAIVLDSSWNKYVTIQFPMPPPGVALGTGGDDAYYLQIGLPTGTTCNLDIAKPAFYLTDNLPQPTIPNNDFATYDEINAIISSPRTGDIRTSLNSFVPYGWVACNDTTIGSAASGAVTADIDTWPLYNFLWTNVSVPSGNTFAPVTGGLGASAIADFGTANKKMTLPLMLGRALLGLPPATTFTYVNGTGIFTVASNALFDVGSPVYLTNTGGAIPSGFALNTIYYAIPIAGSTTTLQVAQSYALAIAGTPFIPASDNGSGTNSLNWLLAGSFGEATHHQLTNEVGLHVHPPLTAGESFIVTGGADSRGAGVSAVQSNGTTGNNLNNAGGTLVSSTPFNIIQPSTYLNVYFKL